MKIVRKKRLIIAVSVITVVCAVGGLALLGLTHLSKPADPAQKAISAMNNVGTEIASHLNGRIDEYMSSLTDDTVYGFSGNIEYEKFTVGSTDFLDLIKTHSVSYSYGTSPGKKQTGGEISVAEWVDEPDVASLYFYTDNNALYFKVPLLSAYNFKLALSTAADYADKAIDENDDIDLGFDSNDITDFLKMFKPTDSETSEEYAKMLKSFIADLQVGYEKAVEEFTYTKLEDTTYPDDRDSYSRDTYSVTITKDALIAGADAAIDAIYDDETISSYRTLISSYYKNSREKLKTAVRKRLENFESSNMLIYVNESSRVAAIQMSCGGSTVIMESFEPNSLTHGSFNLIKNGKNVVYTIDSLDEDTYKFSLRVLSDETDIYIEGEASDMPIDALSVSAADFTNALDITQLTVSQYQSIMSQLMENYDVLEQIISEAE